MRRTLTRLAPLAAALCLAGMAVIMVGTAQR